MPRATVHDVAYHEFAPPEFAPPPRLRGLVECAWSATLGAGDPAHTHDVLPDGCMDLLWIDGELIVAGPDTAPHAVRRAPGGTSVGLRFAPGALPGLLGVPAAALRDQRVPLAELHPRFARPPAVEAHPRPPAVEAHPRRPAVGADRRPPAVEAHRRPPAVKACPGTGPTAPVDLLAGIALALPGRGIDRAAAEVTSRIGAGAGVAATADALGWTTRTLHRRCLESFGYGPAVLRRILRFRRAIALLCAGVGVAEVAARAGYADQPHLSREMRSLAGTSPGQLTANRSTPVPSGSSTTA